MKYAESELQQACVAWFRSSFPGALIAYCNNNASNPRAGYRNKLLGTVKGMPDLIIYHKSGAHSGFAIELKAPGRKASEEQLIILDTLAAQGFLTAVISSLESFKALVSSYMAGSEET